MRDIASTHAHVHHALMVQRVLVSQDVRQCHASRITIIKWNIGDVRVRLKARFHRTALLVGALTLGSAGAAQAASVQFQVTNVFGTSITLDTASCTSGSISVPFSISNGGTATFTGSTSAASTLCTVRYQSGTYGCQFQVQVSSVGGFASTNAYKGSGSRPSCVKISEGSLGTGSYQGKFGMQ